jgi:hypothetical protein
MNQRLEEFLKLSACLSGFERLQLIGTNMTETYLRELDAILSPQLLDELLDVFRGLPGGDGLDSEISKQIMVDPKLGPVARNIILMWYCGTWKTLPHEWRAAYGISPHDKDHVVSAMAYLSALQWTLIGAHPPGGLPQGFNSWSVPAKEHEQ